MTFLAPLGLLALLTLPIIFLLHLRRERLRRVAVPSLLLWQHIPPTSGQQRKLKLPLTLLLLLHLLIATLLALALARPQWIGRLLGLSQDYTIVVLDTSTSMAAQEAPGTNRLDLARAQARARVDAMGPGGSLTLIGAGPQARLLATGSGTNRAGLLAVLDSLEPSGTGTDIAGALALAAVERTSRSEGGGTIVVLSDLDPPEDLVLPVGQAGAAEEQIEWLRVGAARNNLGIVALAARPQRTGPAGYAVYARVANYEQSAAQATLQLFGDDELLDTRVLDLPPTGEADLTWSLPSGIGVLRTELVTADALAADNVAVLGLTQSRQINGLLVSAGAPELERALNALPDLTLTRATPEEYAAAPQNYPVDLTIFDGTLPASWPVGGVLVVNPPVGEHPLLTVEAAPPPQDGTAPMPPTITRPAREQAGPLEGVSLGGVDFGPLLRVQQPEWARPLLLADAQPLMLRGQTGESEIAIWAFAITQSNLPTRLAFPLLTARTVRDLTPPPPQTSLLVGEALTLQPNPRTSRVELVGPTGAQQTFAVSRSLRIESFTAPGLYELAEYADNTPISVGTVSVNAGTPLESDLSARPLPAVSLPYVAQALPPGVPSDRPDEPPLEPVWPWLAMAALGFFIIEWLYVHWR